MDKETRELLSALDRYTSEWWLRVERHVLRRKKMNHMSSPCCACEKSTENMIIITVDQKKRQLAPDMEAVLVDGNYYIYLCEMCNNLLGSGTVKELRHRKRTARLANLAF